MLSPNGHIEQELSLEGIRIDDGSLKSIFDRYFEDLVYFANRNLNDGDKARDVVNDAFLVLWEKRQDLRFMSNSHLRSWLYTVTKTKAISLFRDSIKEQKELAAFGYCARAIQHPEDADSSLFTAAAIAAIRREVAELPPRNREVMELLLEGKSHEEIGNLLGMKQGTLRLNKMRAINLLQKRLGKQVLYVLPLLLLGLQHKIH